MTDYTLRTVPFRIMRPALKMLMVACMAVITQVYSKEWAHQQLATKVFLLQNKTDALKRPTRDTIQVHIAAWFGLALDLQEAVKDTHPELARLLVSATKEVGWIEPAWQFMQERMKTWVTENGAVQ
jgi:hypothetical protein